jgi:hypothetical protein
VAPAYTAQLLVREVPGDSENKLMHTLDPVMVLSRVNITAADDDEIEACRIWKFVFLGRVEE